MQRNIPRMVVALVLAVLQLSACARAPAANTKIEPVQVEPIEGSDLKRVVLTEKAAERLDIRTAAVREEQVVQNRTLVGEVMAVPSTTAGSLSDVGVRVRLNTIDLSLVD